jgi:putative ABC transport system ATP-binding protein
LARTLVINNLRGAIIGPLSLTVASGTCATITGASGAGKSLFLRMIADLDPSEGDVRLGHVARASIPAPDWRRQVMHVAAEAAWWAERVDAHIPADRRTAAIGMADRLGIPEGHFERAPRLLSTGERQRLALVRALVRTPTCLLLDEPTSALDTASVALAETLLREAMDAGTIIVLVSHDRAQAERLGSAHYTLAAGALVAA